MNVIECCRILVYHRPIHLFVEDFYQLLVVHLRFDSSLPIILN
jgi:hypothetical protein